MSIIPAEVRTGLLLAALTFNAGCGHTPNPRTEPRAKIQFEPIPVLEAAHVTNPHDYKGAALCQRCHTLGEQQLSIDPIELCSQCHDPKHMKHPYRVVQPSGAEGLPLMAGRLIACHTCHDPHDVKKHRGGLRAEYVSVCKRCHAAHR
jgi:predicted CXXCH cytochrome family protein